MILPVIGAIVAGILGAFHERSSIWTLATFAGCGFAATATLRDMWKPVADRKERRNESLLNALRPHSVQTGDALAATSFT